MAKETNSHMDILKESKFGSTSNLSQKDAAAILSSGIR